MDPVVDFLAARRVAIVGFSRNPKDFSRTIDEAFRRHGMATIPVNPGAGEIDGRRSFPRVSAIDPPPDAAIVLLPSAQAAAAVDDCLAAGVTRVWLHRGGGPGSASPEALALCAARGVTPVTDLCPFMVLPGTAWPHRLHGWIRRRRTQARTG